MEQYLKKDRIPDIGQRRKSHALLQDIRDPGGDGRNQPVQVDTSVIDSYTLALGAAYVREGSTPGGVIIAKW